MARLTRDRLIERIKKLLAVTEKRGATENEAIAAALAAQKLIADNDVEGWELNDKAEPIEQTSARKTRNWQAFLAIAIADNFRCKCYQTTKKENGSRRGRAYMVFMGHAADVKAASIVYERLADIGGKKANEWAKAKVAEAKAQGRYVQKLFVYNDYVDGFIEGVRSALEKQCQELMLVCPTDVKDAYDGLGLKTRRLNFSRYADDSTHEAGCAAGRDAVNAGRLGEVDSARLIGA